MTVEIYGRRIFGVRFRTFLQDACVKHAQTFFVRTWVRSGI